MQNLIFSCIESRVEDNQTIYGCYKIGPFILEQGATIATALRRVLLSNLPGLAIISVQIEGIMHEYSMLRGVQESVIDILLNLKQIQFYNSRSIYKPQIAYLNIRGPRVVQSKDIRLPYFIQIANPNQYIATVSVNGQLNMKIYICEGQRYILQNSLEFIVKNQFKKILKNTSNNMLVLDAVFFPVDKVNYTIQVNQFLKKEFIILEIWTRSGLHPKKAIYKAINEILKIFIPFRYTESMTKNQVSNLFLGSNMASSKLVDKKRYFLFNTKRKTILKNKILSLDLGNLEISAQNYYSLKKLNIHTISDLIEKPRQQILDFLSNKNDLNEIESNLAQYGLYLKD